MLYHPSIAGRAMLVMRLTGRSSRTAVRMGASVPWTYTRLARQLCMAGRWILSVFGGAQQ